MGPARSSPVPAPDGVLVAGAAEPEADLDDVLEALGRSVGGRQAREVAVERELGQCGA